MLRFSITTTIVLVVVGVGFSGLKFRFHSSLFGCADDRLMLRLCLSFQSCKSVNQRRNLGLRNGSASDLLLVPTFNDIFTGYTLVYKL